MRTFLLLWLFLSCTPQLFAQTYTSYLTGNAGDTLVQPEFGLCLMGGATENDSAMVWFLRRARGGNVVVLRASGADGYNQYLYSDLGVAVHSVETLVLPSVQAANDPYVRQRLLQAEAVFIAGGNQANYVNFWKGTAVDSALNDLLRQRRGAVGGTSAGMAVLGGFYFAALNGSINSASALSNPFDGNITLGMGDFLDAPFLEKVITDTHYDNPDRRGRHAVFMARLQALGQDTVYGIACDEYTAVCIDSGGTARVFGDYPSYDDNAYFVRPNCSQPETLAPATPLTWQGDTAALKVCRIKGTPSGSGSLSLLDWQSGNGGEWLHWSIQNGTLEQTPGTAPVACLINAWAEAMPATETINFYPNPCSGLLFASAPLPPGARIRLFDLAGRLQRQTASFPIETDSLPPGTYLLCLDSETQTQKHLIQIVR